MIFMAHPFKAGGYKKLFIKPMDSTSILDLTKNSVHSNFMLAWMFDSVLIKLETYIWIITLGIS